MIVYRPRELARIFMAALRGWRADNCLSMGAALAFYALLSMAPLLVLVITLAGAFIGRDEAQALLITQLSGLLGDTGAEGVQSVLEAARGPGEGRIQGLVSLLVLMVGATTVFAELQDDLDRIWKVPPSRRAAGIRGLLRQRLLSFGLILALGFLLLVSLVVSAAVAYMGGAWFGGLEAAASTLELAGSLLVVTALFAAVFKLLPGTPIPWRDVLLGSLVTALLFAIGKFVIGLYIGKSAIASDFGAAGTLVAAIVWVYYSSQIFFFGAQLTRAYSLERARAAPPTAAANSDYGTEPAEMVARARRIVRGVDPAVPPAT